MPTGLLIWTLAKSNGIQAYLPKAGVYSLAIRIIVLGLVSMILPVAASLGTLVIPNVHSGFATLEQRGRLTLLALSDRKGIRRIPLTHPSDYPQGRDAPYEGQVIAEQTGHFLIFTDTFTSNEDVQGHCGASPTGERFVHVVALGTFPHETLSVLIESCRIDIYPAPETPEWHVKGDSAGSVGQLILRYQDDILSDTCYYISSDGSVSRPQAKCAQ